MLKLYKGKLNPPPYRPVVATVGYQFYCISRWVDYYLRQLLLQIPSYVKNSDDIINILNSFNNVLEYYYVFTADAVAMYPNIDTEEGLTFIIIALDNYIFKIQSN